MSDKTGISWTDATWNPIRGCSRVSEGCRNCYAEAQAARTNRQAAGAGRVGPYDGLVSVRAVVSGMRYTDVSAAGAYDLPRWTGEVRMVPEHLADPLRWKKPRRIFVNSMSDLFHESLTNEQIAAVFGVMAACPQHTFQVLTKRARRMREWFEWVADQCSRRGRSLFGAADNEWDVIIANTTREFHVAKHDDRAWSRYLVENDQREDECFEPWPLWNVWLGVSVEDQAAADERIPELLRTPAAVRFLSCEPLIGPVTLHSGWMGGSYLRPDAFSGRRIDWVIAGCESGPRARPCSVEWLRSLRDQCAHAGVAFFLKQATECTSDPLVAGPDAHADLVVGSLGDVRLVPQIAAWTGSKRKGRGVIELPYLDGVQHAAFPEGTR